MRFLNEWQLVVRATWFDSDPLTPPTLGDPFLGTALKVTGARLDQPGEGLWLCEVSAALILPIGTRPPNDEIVKLVTELELGRPDAPQEYELRFVKSAERVVAEQESPA